MTDPLTKARRHEANPEAEWTRASVPDLRIVDEDLWTRTRKMLALHSAHPAAFSSRPTKRPASVRAPSVPPPSRGWVRCGGCGGVANLADRRRYVCRDRRGSRRNASNYRAVTEPTIPRAGFSLAEGSSGRRVRHTLQDRGLDPRSGREVRGPRRTGRPGSKERIGRLLVVVEEGIETGQGVRAHPGIGR